MLKTDLLSLKVNQLQQTLDEVVEGNRRLLQLHRKQLPIHELPTELDILPILNEENLWEMEKKVSETPSLKKTLVKS